MKISVGRKIRGFRLSTEMTEQRKNDVRSIGDAQHQKIMVHETHDKALRKARNLVPAVGGGTDISNRPGFRSFFRG